MKGDLDEEDDLAEPKPGFLVKLFAGDHLTPLILAVVAVGFLAILAYGKLHSLPKDFIDDELIPQASVHQ